MSTGIAPSQETGQGLARSGPYHDAVEFDPRERTALEVRELTSLDELRAATRLFGRLWSEPGGALPISEHVLKALSLSGNYVSGALCAGQLVGASVAWAGPPERRELHSHVTGVEVSLRRHGVGLALKQHQRAWALERGIETITWTFDPLIRRNAVFNLRRLNASVEAYLVNVYGPMDDALNSGEESDRLLVCWHLDAGTGGDATADRGGDTTAGSPVTAAAKEADGGAAPLFPAIVAGPGGRPEATGHVADRAFLVEVPEDVERLRQENPAAATTWRQVVRSVLGDTLADGGRITGLDSSGRYVVERSGVERYGVEQYGIERSGVGQYGIERSAERVPSAEAAGAAHEAAGAAHEAVAG